MEKKIISILFIIVSILGLAFIVFYYQYTESKIKDRRVIPKKMKIIKHIVQEPEEFKKENKDVLVDDIFLVEEVPEIVEELPEIKKPKVPSEEEIHQKLQTRMDLVYKQCKDINTKKGIKNLLKKMKYKDVFISDMRGNTHYGSNNVEDMNARTILLEEIQKVGRHGGGFIKSSTDYSGTIRYILVKDLSLSNWFIGVEKYKKVDEVW